MNDVITPSSTYISENRIAEVMSRGQMEEALLLILESGINPASKTAIQMRAMAHLRKNDFPKCGSVLLNLLQIDKSATTWKMLGDWHFLQNQYLEARRAYKQALDQMPNSPEIQHDYGVTFSSTGDVKESVPYFERACQLGPDNGEFKHHLALMRVLSGDEERGWEEMEARVSIPSVVGNFPNPEKYWKGEDLDGKVIVVRSEQGFGDTIQFARYLPLLQKARKIIFYCQWQMVSWVQSEYPFVECVPNVCPPPLEFDYHVCLMSFPHIFKGEYLTRPKREETGQGVGICWFGSPTHKADHLRTIDLQRFEPIFNTGAGPWYCAAYGHFEQKPDFINYLIDDAKDWKDTADRLKKLRLLITVDTAVAHLAGHHGIPTWLLLPFVPDFRWGMTGETTPWYESVKVYRQPKLFDWDSVLKRVENDLREMYAQK